MKILPQSRLIPIALVVLLTTLALGQMEDRDERHLLYYHSSELRSRMNGGSVQPNWLADGSSFWYVEGRPADTVIWRVDPTANARSAFFNTSRLRQKLTPLLGHELPGKGLPFRKFEFLDESEEEVQFSVEERDFILNLDSYRIIQAADQRVRASSQPSPSETESPDGGWFAQIRGHNVFLRPAHGGEAVELTTDGTEDVPWGSSDPWERALAWSPDSSKLAIESTDYHGVPKIPLVRFLEPTERVEWVRYSRPNEPKPQSELFILDVPTKRKVRVDIGRERDQHITVLSWRVDGSELFFLRHDRYFVIVDLLAADPTDGSTRALLTDEGMRGLHPREFPKAFYALDDGTRFIWRSERDGWNHLYLYDLNGTQLRRLTNGAFPVGEVVTVDEKAGWVYFTAQGDPKRLYDTHIYRVDLQGERLTKLTEAQGQHEGRFSPSKAFFLDTHSAVSRPPAVELRTTKGTLLRTLSKADGEVLDRLRWRPPEEVVVKAADDETDLWGVLYKPYDFDPSKKYPVINAVFGWPGFIYAPHSFTGHRWQGLANFGFVVWVLDGRGTTGRGRDFRRMIFGNIGRYEVPDSIAGLKQAAERRPYIDMDHIGVFGLSYGGYTALRAMLTAPDVYDVGVAAYPISDMAGHWWNESLFGPIKDNQAAYEYASNLPLAERLKGKLLLIHGTSDRAVPFSHTMKMVDALIQANKRFDLIVLPERGHSAGADYWWDAVRRYFEEHLKP